MKLKDPSARFFEFIARSVIQKKYYIFSGMIIIAMIIGLQLKTFKVDTSTEGLLHESDPDRIVYNDFRKQFGRDELIMVVVGPVEVYSENFLKKFKAFHSELNKDVPHIDELTSLINARNTHGEGDSLIIEDCLEGWPENNIGMETLQARVRNNHTYKNVLIDETERYVSLLIKTNVYSSLPEHPPAGDSAFQDFENEGAGPTNPIMNNDAKPFFNDKENQETVNAVKRIVAAYNTDTFPIHLSGSPVVSAVLKTWMMKDMRKFTILALMAISLILFLLFQRLSAVLIAVSTIGLSFICTFGIMAVFDIPIKIPTVLIPSFILSVSVCYGVHILSLFYRNITLGEDKNDAIIDALGHSGLAIVLTSLTTAGGLLSFIHAKIAPIEDLGVFSAIGVMVSLMYSLLWLPSLLAILPSPAIKQNMAQTNHRIDRILAGFGRFAVRRSYVILGVVVLIVALSLAGISKLCFTHSSLAWLPIDSDERKATELIDDVFKGTLAIELILSTQHKNGILEPEVMEAIDQFGNTFEHYTDAHVFVGKTLAISDILKETNRALNENKEEYYTIPQKDLIAQELFLFEISSPDDMYDFVDSQFQKTRITMKIPWKDSSAFNDLTQSISNFMDTHFKNMTFQLTGLPMLMSRTLNAIIESMLTSYIVAMVVITIMMILFIGNLKLGLISMVPNLLPIAITLGIMGWMNIKLDAFTMTIGAIAIGLAVDDTIHFMNNFKRYYALNQNVHDSVEQTLLTSGRAMMFTSIILTSGFLIYCFSFLNNLNYFGLFTALTIIFAFFADCLVSPALIAVLFKTTVPTTDEDMDRDYDHGHEELPAIQ